MRIECPTCSAVYDLPERLLSGGPRTLRCAACGNTWTVNPGAPEEPAAPEAEAPPSPPPPAQAPQGPLSSDRNFAALMEAVVGTNRDEVPGPREPAATVATTLPEDTAEPADQADQAEPANEAEEPPEPPPAAVVARPSGAPAPSRPSFGLIMAWVATLGGLGALILAFALYPEGVVAHWPAAARLYEAVGITFGAS